jgi:hypothetical protein
MSLDSRPRSIRLGCGGAPLRFFVFACLLLSICGCGEDDNPLGFDRGPAGADFARPETLRISAPAADVETRPLRETSSAVSILVGNDSSAVARGLILFSAIPDTTGMSVAYIRLHVRRGQGGPVTLVVRRILGASDSWTASTVTYDTPIDTSEVIARLTNVPTGTAPRTFSQLRDMPIPFDIIRDWYQDSDHNAGVILSIAGGSGIASFVSHNDVILDDDGVGISTPLLILSADSTKTTTRTARATADAYVSKSHRPTPGPSDPVSRIGAGPPARTLVRFDLATLPRQVSIVNATMRIPQLESFLDSAKVSVYNITEDWTEEAVPDSLSLASAAVDSDWFYGSLGALKLDVGPLVQAWIDEKASNYGVAVRFADELAAPRSIRVATREDPDPAHRPSLEIVFLRAESQPPWGGAR